MRLCRNPGFVFVISTGTWAEEEPVAEDELKKKVEQLEEELQDIKNRLEEQELEQLIQQAETEAVTAPDEPKGLKEKVFITASRSLQMLNPEISVSGDFLAQFVADEGFYASEHDRSGLPIRALDMHIQSSLDPFSLTKIAIGFDPNEGEASVEEMYITWAGFLPNLSITLGRFRHLFGVINRWHEHDLDQTGYPLALTELFGEAGLAQTGLSLKWLMPPLLAHTNELTVEITDGVNETLFAGDHFSVPSGLLHLKNYYDLTENTYLELGLTGMAGVNNRRGYSEPADPDTLLDEEWRPTWVGGVDLTLHWEPLKQARYRALTWRSVWFGVNKETAHGWEDGWGAYSYLQYQLAEQWYAGARIDAVWPLEEERERLLWQVVPYVTFWQSEFVYIRLEVRHGEHLDDHDTRVLLQVDWAAGPHKHEKY